MKTIETSQTKNETGAIGIGAMIVFIALILVAAVASAVIIQTAETLQQNAQSVGDDTQEEIAGKVQIIGAFYAEAGADAHIIFSLAPGSGSLKTTAIQWQVFCIDDAPAFVQDADDFDAEAITTLDGVTTIAAAAAGTVVAGQKYFTSITLANCAPVDVNTGWGAGDNDGTINFNIHVNGGGTTMEILDVSGSLTDGDSIL